MDILLLLKALIMGIVEGLTEFLPVSSTGHLILLNWILGFEKAIGGKEIADTFEIVIQLGGVLAILVYFGKDLLGLLSRAAREPGARRLLINVLIAFVPAAVIGLLLQKQIKLYLFGPVTVAVALILGGVIMLLIERMPYRPRAVDLEDINARQALGIGLAQVASLWSGVSRSASTVVGGLLAGLDRATAVRFSFYLMIPTLGAATLYSLFKSRDTFSAASFPALAVGLIAAFVASLGVIRFFLDYVSRKGISVFAWYRIGVGIVVLLVAVFTSLPQ